MALELVWCTVCPNNSFLPILVLGAGFVALSISYPCEGDKMKTLLANVKQILEEDFVYMHHEDEDFVPPNPAHKAYAETLLESVYYCVNCEYESMDQEQCATGPNPLLGF